MSTEPINVSIIFYSMYGHIHQMAEAVAEGANSIPGVDATIYQVPELVPDKVLKNSGAWEIKQAFDHIPEATPAVLEESDAVIFGTPTRFGMMASQMRNFLDQTGKQWAQGALTGKVGSVFASVGGQHGGHETTIRSFHTTLLHHGMAIVGVPYFEDRLNEVEEISGGTPYGATTVAGPTGNRTPTQNELEIAKTQGRHVAQTALKLSAEPSPVAAE
ncbi:NAD(P)H:quinone oxidoreductase [Fodinibius salsisoli]|uniref:NAD(P)H dehydrogenase (quinone) n=1 Tax=Fodinibius salsisoli TaxID=2820877 RepID=A0ABT3PH24_9BACT|nr:NAD(P)H:quinone oxidoreductase [Fodinibius salsisoli]MCW9705215.1 NAD(P)H:quinone oxidoreductase [Fodinibius salsisoli]